MTGRTQLLQSLLRLCCMHAYMRQRPPNSTSIKAVWFSEVKSGWQSSRAGQFLDLCQSDCRTRLQGALTILQTPPPVWKRPACWHQASWHGHAPRCPSLRSFSAEEHPPDPPAARQPAAAAPLLPPHRSRPACCRRQGKLACCALAGSLALHPYLPTHHHLPSPRRRPAWLLRQRLAPALLLRAVRLLRGLRRLWVLHERRRSGCRPCPAWTAAAALPALQWRQTPDTEQGGWRLLPQLSDCMRGVQDMSRSDDIARSI